MQPTPCQISPLALRYSGLGNRIRPVLDLVRVRQDREQHHGEASQFELKDTWDRISSRHEGTGVCREGLNAEIVRGFCRRARRETQQLNHRGSHGR
jgi:hypothetical protein